MEKIIEGVYLGDIRAAANFFLLKQNGITHILQVMGGLNPCFPTDFIYKVIPDLLDLPWENLQRHFAVCFRFIKEALSNGGKILLNCYAGVSRSPSILIGYLMKEHQLPFFQTLNLVKEKKKDVFPNKGFQRQLLQYEKQLLDKKFGTGTHFSKQRRNSNQHKSAIEIQGSQAKMYVEKKNLEKFNLFTNALLENKVEEPQIMNNSKQQNNDRYKKFSRNSRIKSATGQRPSRSKLAFPLRDCKIENQQNNDRPISQLSQDSCKTDEPYQRKSVPPKQSNELLKFQKSTPQDRIKFSVNLNQHKSNLVSPCQKQFPTAKSSGLNSRRGSNYDADDVKSVISQAQHILNQNERAIQQRDLETAKAHKKYQIGRSASSCQMTDQQPSYIGKKPALQYHCRFCQTALFTDLDLITHDVNNNMRQSQNQEDTSYHLSAELLSQLDKDTVANRSIRAESLPQNGRKSACASLDHDEVKSVISEAIFGSNKKLNQDRLSIGDFERMVEGNGYKAHRQASYFIAKPDWFNHQYSENLKIDGSIAELHCPNKACMNKIGHFSIEGLKCESSDFFVAPAFRLQKRKLKCTLLLKQTNAKQFVGEYQDNQNIKNNQAKSRQFQKLTVKTEPVNQHSSQADLINNYFNSAIKEESTIRSPDVPQLVKKTSIISPFKHNQEFQRHKADQVSQNTHDTFSCLVERKPANFGSVAEATKFKLASIFENKMPKMKQQMRQMINDKIVQTGMTCLKVDPGVTLPRYKKDLNIKACMEKHYPKGTRAVDVYSPKRMHRIKTNQIKAYRAACKEERDKENGQITKENNNGFSSLKRKQKGSNQRLVKSKSNLKQVQI